MEEVNTFGGTLYGIAIDSRDNIFVANFGENLIEIIEKNSVKKGLEVLRPRSLAFDVNENLYVGTSSTIWKTKRDEAKFECTSKIEEIFSAESICFDDSGNGYVSFMNSVKKFTSGQQQKNEELKKVEKEQLSSTPQRMNSLTLTNINKYGVEARFSRPLGIAFNRSSRLLFIADIESIRVMTLEGNVSTFGTYDVRLYAIAIDGMGNLFATCSSSLYKPGIARITSTGEFTYVTGEEDLVTSYGVALNSMGDLFFTSEKKLYVIKNCTSYPPNPLSKPNTYSPVPVTSPNTTESPRTSSHGNLYLLYANVIELEMDGDDIIDIRVLGEEKYWKKIGEGGFSEVFLASYFGSNVAVKKYTNQDMAINSPLFKKEFRALK